MSYFELNDDGTIIAHCRGGTKLDLEKAVEELNSLEKYRKEKNMRIEELTNDLVEMNQVLCGMETYVKLKVKGVIW